MKIHETLERDPLQSSLANNGQARIVAHADERSEQELRAELETFVCDGQYGDAIQKILDSYLTQLDRPRQNAAWIGGFYGSGKSHLLKMLGHLWVNTPFSDGAAARTLVPELPDEVKAQLRELDMAATRTGLAQIAAANTLPSGVGDQVRRTVLGVILHACGLPTQYPQAQFCFWLREEGYLDHVRDAVKREGRDWFHELNNLYVSPIIAQAVLECDPNFAADEREARQVLRSRFPDRPGDITTAEFIEATRQALAPQGEMPVTVLLLDEVQEYIGDSRDRVVAITELVEAIQTQLDSRVMVVMSGQSALSGTQLLQKMQDRFRIQVQLSDADVEAVTRKVLLRKKPKAVEPIRNELERNAGEISKHLQGTKLAEQPEDQAVLVPDYPLLPTRRRFWEETFRAVDAAGTHSQLRSQLRIIYDALHKVAEEDVGALIPGDALFEAIAPDLVNTGVLLNEISTRIEELDDGTEEGRLRKRIVSLVFLINKLPREEGVDVGLRATPRMIADLLVADLSSDSGPLRRQVEEQLEALQADGELMKVDEEYRLQTTEGAEWDRAFRERLAALSSGDAEIERKRQQLLAKEVQAAIDEVDLKHGDSKLRRKLYLHAGTGDPPTDTDQVVVWLQDGWSVPRTDVEEEARRRGLDDPVIHVFVPKAGAQDLSSRIREAEAARRALDIKGHPAGDEGKEARRSMESRLQRLEAERDELIRDVIRSARVYQGGGHEIHGDLLETKIQEAAEDSLSRLFPQFEEGDHRSWETALKRARDGSDHPLTAVDWDRDTEEHPVVRQVLSQIGDHTKGNEIRKTLRAPPFGWPQDAIDAALISLHSSGVVRAEQNGEPIAVGGLDQNKISSAVFQRERVRLGTSEKLAIRGLYERVGVRARSGEEALKAGEFLGAVRQLARDAGGDPPLPEPPSTATIDELRQLSGNDQLAAILEAKDELESCVEEWQELKERRDERLPQWDRLQKMLEHAEGLPVAEEVRPDVEAIRDGRSLLDETDYLASLRQTLEDGLRRALKEAHDDCEQVFQQELSSLQITEAWQRLDEESQQEILRAHRIKGIDEIDVSDEESLMAALAHRGIQGWRELAEALPTRFAQAREKMARAQEPSTHTVKLQSHILNSEEDVDEWVQQTRDRLLKELENGPIVIN